MGKWSCPYEDYHRFEISEWPAYQVRPDETRQRLWWFAGGRKLPARAELGFIGPSPAHPPRLGPQILLGGSHHLCPADARRDGYGITLLCESLSDGRCADGFLDGAIASAIARSMSQRTIPLRHRQHSAMNAAFAQAAAHPPRAIDSSSMPREPAGPGPRLTPPSSKPPSTIPLLRPGLSDSSTVDLSMRTRTRNEPGP
jgi:hypothetical protein